MDEVAAAVKLNKATVYHYFASKAELLYTIYIETSTIALETIQSLPPDTPADDAVRKLIQANLETAAGRPNETAVYFHEMDWIKEWLPENLYKDVHEKEAAYFAELRALLARGREEGLFGDVDTNAAVQVIAGVVAWASRGNRPSVGPIPAEFGTPLAHAVLGGLLRR
jgi:AcrR family transcriptional regulator